MANNQKEVLPYLFHCQRSNKLLYYTVKPVYIGPLTGPNKIGPIGRWPYYKGIENAKKYRIQKQTQIMHDQKIGYFYLTPDLLNKSICK